MRRDRHLDAALRRFAGVALVVGAAAVGAEATAVAQEHGAILGTVRELESGRPLAGALVALVGAPVRAETDAAGRYHLLTVPAGDAHVRIQHPGYATMVEELTVPAGGTVVAHFHLPTLAMLLAGLTVAGGQAPQPALQLREAPGAPLADVLARAAPGLDVFRGSGQVGAGTRLRLRGPRSLTGAEAPPLVYIDGVRVEFAAGAPGAGVLGASILDMLDAATIERVQVLRGPEAAAYGLGAANGVILITTKGSTRPR